MGGVHAKAHGAGVEQNQAETPLGIGFGGADFDGAGSEHGVTDLGICRGGGIRAEHGSMEGAATAEPEYGGARSQVRASDRAGGGVGVVGFLIPGGDAIGVSDAKGQDSGLDGRSRGGPSTLGVGLDGDAVVSTRGVGEGAALTDLNLGLGDGLAGFVEDPSAEGGRGGGRGDGCGGRWGWRIDRGCGSGRWRGVRGERFGRSAVGQGYAGEYDEEQGSPPRVPGSSAMSGDGMNPFRQRVGVFENAEDGGLGSVRRPTFQQADDGVTVGASFGFRETVQGQGVGGQFTILAEPSEGQPDDGIEPMQRGQEGGGGVGERVASAEVGQFVEQHVTKGLGSELAAEVAGQQEPGTEQSEHRWAGHEAGFPDDEMAVVAHPPCALPKQGKAGGIDGLAVVAEPVEEPAVAERAVGEQGQGPQDPGPGGGSGPRERGCGRGHRFGVCPENRVEGGGFGWGRRGEGGREGRGWNGGVGRVRENHTSTRRVGRVRGGGGGWRGEGFGSVWGGVRE